MKIMKNSLAFLLAVMMLLTLAAPALAEEPTSGTIVITNAATGRTYNLYKIFDATYTGSGANAHTAYSISKASQFITEVKTEASKDTGALFTMFPAPSVDADVYSVVPKDGLTAQEVITWIKSLDLTEKDAESTETLENTETINTVSFTELDFGYYFITTVNGSVITIDSANPEAAVTDKNLLAPGKGSDPNGSGNAADAYKYIDLGENTSPRYVASTTATRGKDVDFLVQFSATNYHTKEDKSTKQILKYVIQDLPSGGLIVDTSSFEVYVGTTKLTEGENAGYTLDAANKTITIPWATQNGTNFISKYHAPVDVKITFKAEMAASGTETNDVKIDYVYVEETTLNNLVNKVDGNPQTTVSNNSFVLEKTDGTNQLSGAEFKLYNAATGGTAIEFIANDDGSYSVANSSNKAAADYTPAIIEVGETTIKGLKPGTYYLEETKAPDGYNILTSRQAVTVDSDDANNETGKTQVVNQAGIELPSTGGVGTTVFYIAGGVLVLLAIVLLAGKKRGDEKKR